MEKLIPQLKQRLLEEVTKNHETIYPCGTKSNLDDCFDIVGDTLLFWFNTRDKNTHMVMEKIDSKQQQNGSAQCLYA